jgi:LPXTG-motif cell wall-anchored protein
VEDTDPKPPQTGDDFPLLLTVVLLVVSAAGLVLIIVLHKREK